MVHVLDNCSHIVDVGQAQCTIETDRVREMTAIKEVAADQGGLPFINQVIKAALITGKVSIQQGVLEVDNFLCGEAEGLRKLPLNKIQSALFTVCAAGLVELLDKLLEVGDLQQQDEDDN